MIGSFSYTGAGAPQLLNFQRPVIISSLTFSAAGVGVARLDFDGFSLDPVNPGFELNRLSVRLIAAPAMQVILVNPLKVLEVTFSTSNVSDYYVVFDYEYA